MTWNAALKIYNSVEDALDGLHSGCTVMVGGFVLTGVPENIINYVATQANIQDLTIISNDGGRDNFGLGKLYANGQISRHHASYIGKGKAMEQAYLTGKTELHLTPQGTLAEKIRGCGAGIPAFFTATGLNTLYAEGKLPVRFNQDGSVAQYNAEHAVSRIADRDVIFETSFEKADFAWVKASRADKMGNCVFKGTSFNFNGIMAKGARTVIVEAEELVEIGDIPPEQVHLPGLYVNRLFIGSSYERRMDFSTACATTSPLLPTAQRAPGSDLVEVRELIARVVAQELVPGTKCNLGVGIPTLAAGYAAEKGVKVFLQGENGVLGCGPYPAKGQEDHNWTNAGSESITPLLGASTFGSDESFAQIRGGHLDMTILGALECSQYGDVANFMIPGKLVKGMGGAMDLVSNPASTNVIVVQTHVDKYGEPKIKENCTLPVTGTRCVRKIVTDLAVFDVDFEDGLTMTKYNPGTTVDMIRSKTGASFKVSPFCTPWKI